MPPKPLTTLKAGFITIACLGVAALGGAAAGAVAELTREPTAAELKTAARAEQALRWRTWTAGRIFPTELRNVDGDPLAGLVGIAPAASCATGLNAAAYEVATSLGCRRVLRATYADPTRTRLVTLGVVVLKDEAGAAAFGLADGAVTAGPQPVAFPATDAALFGAKAVQKTAYNHVGRYAVLAAEGYADGRPEIKPGDAIESGLADDAAYDLVERLSQNIPPCEVKAVIAC
ncbi:hypothetical protein HII36_49645 [Nonomuraea sp. NN258]|uniref:hypothetical protein n=1 Tax=Nonomuraea antri TaxID=2730852 RepID=UPI0015688FA4|nr:hypothetical protein [Nonomuraea antri]NRQ39842.1 hypothetical protein [Nonomuraea antri]